MQRTLCMCAKVVAIFRRFAHGGCARQTSGLRESRSTWLMRSLVRNASINACPKSTGCCRSRLTEARRGARAFVGAFFGIGVFLMPPQKQTTIFALAVAEGG